MRTILILLASAAIAFAAPLSGPITADGTYTVSTSKGQRYVFAVAGTFGGGSLAINWNDGTNSAAYPNSPATTAETWTFTAASNQTDIVLSGATNPSLTVSVSLATGASALQSDDIASGTITPKTGDLDFNSLGAPTNASVNTAIATDPNATIEAIGLTSPVEFGHRINTQPYTMKKIVDYDGGTAPPIRIAAWGDSFSSGLRPPSNASLSGRFGLVPTSTTGTVTTQNNASTRWLNKVTYTFATGSTGLMCFGGSSSNWERGDKCAVAYIKNSSGGSFDLQYESSLNPGTYVTLATINTNNGTESGAYNEYTLPTTNSPFFRLRIANVTTASVVLVTAGVYCSDGGGVIWIPIEPAAGMSPSEISIPNDTFSPIWAGLAPDVMLTSWLETGGTEWETGGGFRAIYDQSKAVRSATDWVMVGPHYVRTDVAPSASVLDAQVKAMRDFALEKNETFFDSRPMFRTWAESDALGLMSNDGGGQHLSSSGAALRMHHVYHSIPLGRFQLGATANNNDFFVPMIRQGTEPGTTLTKSVTVSRPLHVQDSSGVGIVAWDMSNPRDFTKAGRISAAASTDPNGLAEIRLGLAGNWNIRSSTQMTRITTGLSLRPPDSFTAASSSLSRGSLFAACDATANNITLSLANNAADTPGRMHIIKKIDSSANTVTIDPSGSETIDGASTYVLTSQWQTVVIQSTGSTWYVVSKF